MDEIMSTLQGYFDGLKSRGAKLPAWSLKDKPHFRAISAASGVPLSYLRQEPYHQKILLASREIGVAKREGTFEAKREASFEENRALLNNYLTWLKDNGLKLPADPRHRGKVFYEQVVIEAGLSPRALRLRKTDGEQAYIVRLLRMVDGALKSLGSEVRVLPQSPGHHTPSFTYQDLIERGSAERKKELEGKPKAEQQLYNTRTALNRFLKVLKLEKTAVIGNELTSEFKTALEKVVGAVTNNSSRKKIKTGIYWWRDCYGRLIKGPALPDELNEIIKHVCDRSGLTQSVIAKLIGIGPGSLRAWYKNTETPSKLSVKPLERMEVLFKLPAGILTNKISGWHDKRFRKSQLPKFLQDEPQLLRSVRPHLPDNFCSLPLKKQEEIVESICTEILYGDDEYSKRLRVLSRLRYRLKKWPGAVLREFKSYADFKLAKEPPRGMKRNMAWRATTKKKCETDLAALFGAVCLPPDAKDERLRGIGFPKPQLTLALLVCPEVIKWYVKFRCEARNQYTEYPIGLLHDFISMLQPETGWLRQSPHLVARLKPFADDETTYISRALVKRAKSNWGRVCDDAIKEYNKLISEIEPRATVARDPFHRIEGLVNLADPMKPFGTLICEMEGELPSRHTQPVYYHIGVRNLVMIILAVLTGFRVTTLMKLDFTGDKSGQLYLEEGKYVLLVPRKFFKCPNSSFFKVNRTKVDFRMVLPDKFGLYKRLKEYLEVSRPFLMSRTHGPSNEYPLFPTSAETEPEPDGVEPASARLKAASASTIYAKKMEKHLVRNKHRGTGYPKVQKTGLHSIRYVRGTKAYKKTRSFKSAGDANQNSERTAEEHYSRFKIEERIAEVTEVLLDD
jgi:hypothetical protein